VAATALIGAFLLFAGIVCLAIAALGSGGPSDAGREPGDRGVRTLEPRESGLGFFGLRANRPGLVLMALGALLLLAVGLM
jgi:hypothetical protein